MNMPPKPKTTHPELPPRMVVRSWHTKKGIKRAYYYERPRDENNKRVLESLGTDFRKAKQKWGEIEGVKVEKPSPGTLSDIYTAYMKWANKLEVSGLKLRTIKDRENYWKKLKPVFGHIQINHFKSSWFHDYFATRTSQISAKKEIKFVSTMFTWAKAFGLCDIANPIQGQTRMMKVKENRDILITDIEFKAVLSCAEEPLQDYIKCLYATGGRVSETLALKISDFNQHNELLYDQGKTGVKKRLIINDEFKDLVAKRKAIHAKSKITLIDPPLLLDKNGNKLVLGGNVRNMFKKARDKAQLINPQIRRFQLKDIRPYAATEKYRREGLEETRKFLGHTTTTQTVKYIRRYLGELSDTLNTEKHKDGESKMNYGESS